MDVSTLFGVDMDFNSASLMPADAVWLAISVLIVTAMVIIASDFINSCFVPIKRNFEYYANG